MKISDLMQTDLATIAADASLGEALTMLVDAHVLALTASSSVSCPRPICSKRSPSVAMGTWESCSATPASRT